MLQHQYATGVYQQKQQGPTQASAQYIPQPSNLIPDPSFPHQSSFSQYPQPVQPQVQNQQQQQSRQIQQSQCPPLLHGPPYDYSATQSSMTPPAQQLSYTQTPSLNNQSQFLQQQRQSVTPSLLNQSQRVAPPLQPEYSAQQGPPPSQQPLMPQHALQQQNIDTRLTNSQPASQSYPPPQVYPRQSVPCANGMESDPTNITEQRWKPGAQSIQTASNILPSQQSQPGSSTTSTHPNYPQTHTNGLSIPGDSYGPLSGHQQQQQQASSQEDDILDGARPAPPPQVKVETLTKCTSSRIDPAFVPRPLYPTEPISQPGGKRFETDKYTVPPPPYGVYTIIDRGSASCRFIRSSLNQLPTVAQTLKSTGVPMVVIATPFPVQGEYEDPLPSINLNRGSQIVSEDAETEGPPRCPRCHSYVSPFMTFPDELSSTCNFCGHTFLLPKHYQYALSEYSRLRHSEYTENDFSLLPYDRLEIIHGSVDYAAPQAFIALTGNKSSVKSNFYPGEFCLPAPAFCFAVDTSASAQQSGLTMAAIGAIKYALSSIENPATKVCLCTFDRSIKFYPITKKLDTTTNQQQILIVTDVADPFFPAHSNTLLTTVTEARAELETLLNELPKLINADNVASSVNSSVSLPAAKAQSCGNAALCACVRLLSSRGGGAVKIFYGSSPDVGMGALQRMNLASATTNKETIHPLHPVENLVSFYSDLVVDCVANGVAVDSFVAAQPNRHIGVSTLGYVSRRTGGYCNYYGNFDLTQGYQRLCMDLSRQLQLPQGYDCLFKIRCSRGFTISGLLIPSSLGVRDAKLDIVDPSNFRMPRIDGDTSLLFELKHEGEVPEDSRAAYIQYAVLHTTLSGVRRIRVVTLAVAVTNSLSTTFRYSEVESVLSYFVRKYSHSIMSSSSQSKWKEDLVKELVEILFSYRLNCAATTSSGQLILPDALKSLPVYISGLFKNVAFRSSTDLHNDEKDSLLGRLLHVPLHQLILLIYPRLYVLHRSYTQFKGEKLRRIGCDTGLENEVYLPPVVGSSGERITTDGIYLLDNGLTLLLYCGMDVDPQILLQVFGTQELTEENVMRIDCEQLQGELGKNINRAINQLRKMKGLAHPWQPLQFIRPRSLEESYFTWHLVEDKLGSEASYVDFLCQLHKAVYNRMEDA